MKSKILITSLTSCSGCTGLIFTLDIFKQFLEMAEITYFPFLKDEDTIEENDIAIIEGCVSEIEQESQVKLLKEIRKKSKRVYALGTCATHGGILSLNSEKQGSPIANFIDIEGMIPGCPPPLKLMGNALINILENKPIMLSEKNMCNSCILRDNLKSLSTVKIEKLMPDKPMNWKEFPNCFLNDGILCLGPITREGCESTCIKLGIPCEGCMGSISQDFTSSLINFLSLIKISDDLRKYEGIYYRFSRPKIKWSVK